MGVPIAKPINTSIQLGRPKVKNGRYGDRVRLGFSRKF